MKPEVYKCPDWDIKNIIKNVQLTAHFQPIVSVNRKSVVGIEGLIRGISTYSEELIPPMSLFDSAGTNKLSLELDRVCREKVLDEFSKIYQSNKDKLLFINIDTSTLVKGAGSNFLAKQTIEHHICPRNIVIEINESKVQGNNALIDFTKTYRDYGFLIALDDVGTGFSNMDRILMIKPDIIKVDISLVQNIHHDYYKQGVFKSLVNLSNRLGALVIAEGVETGEDAIQILRLGGHMIQGYYFAKPQEIKDTIFINKKIEALSKGFNQYINKKIDEEKRNRECLNKITRKSIKILKDNPCQNLNQKLENILAFNDYIECAYILDQNGIQISDTIRFPGNQDASGNLFFFSAKKGTDHSMEKYFYPLISAKLKAYITEPYISLATGNLCITKSDIFYGVDKQKYILCMDFKVHEQISAIELRKDPNIPDSVFTIEGKSINDIHNMIGKMSEQIFKDGLTDSFNRRYIEERLLVDIYNASNKNLHVSLILADIDHFKQVNDTYGHLAGDYVLKRFVNIAKSNIRKSSDWIARYGGEEFLIVLFNADENTAYEVAEKIRNSIETAIINYKKQKIRFTASFGTYPALSTKMTCEQIIDQADKNLYLAKNSGRNKTIGGPIPLYAGT